MNGCETQIASPFGFSPAGSDRITRILDGTLYGRTPLPFFGNGGHIMLRVHSGEGRLFCGDREYPMIPGQVLLYRADLPAAADPAGDSLTLSAFRLESGPAETPRGTAPVSPPYYMAAMKNILDTRYAERISLDSISRELHMNKFKLAKEFKLFFAASPIDYLIGRRMESAAKLLFATERSVTEIAADVCMENVSYFVRRFREAYGMTPLRYRLAARAAAEDIAEV